MYATQQAAASSASATPRQSLVGPGRIEHVDPGAGGDGDRGVEQPARARPARRPAARGTPASPRAPGRSARSPCRATGSSSRTPRRAAAPATTGATSSAAAAAARPASARAAATSWRTATTPAGPIAAKAWAPIAAPTWALSALPSIVAMPRGQGPGAASCGPAAAAAGSASAAAVIHDAVLRKDTAVREMRTGRTYTLSVWIVELRQLRGARRRRRRGHVHRRRDRPRHLAGVGVAGGRGARGALGARLLHARRGGRAHGRPGRGCWRTRGAASPRSRR